MRFPPPSPESRQALRRLRDETMLRGDQVLSVLLAGLDLYFEAGREMELLEAMRDFAAHMTSQIDAQTLSPKELQRLYELRDPRTAPGGGGGGAGPQVQ